LADRILDGHCLTPEEGLAILRSPDSELLDLLAAAYRVRYRYCGNRVYLNFLVNAKSGHCGEDCGYCSQSRVSQAEIVKYPMLPAEEIAAGACEASRRGAGTYCIVTSGRAPSASDLEIIAEAVRRIKRSDGADANPLHGQQQPSLRICVSTGLLSAENARRLKACGVDRINHNLNTSQRFYSRICTTHGYEERLATLENIRQAGLEICCGGIVGMGEEDQDVVDLALRLAALRVEATPVNFLMPVPGTPVEHLRRLNPRYCLKVLALFRMANPQAELRIAGGRELHLGPLQPLGLYAANSIFAGDYLTTKGQPPDDDYRMIEALGFEIVLEGSGMAVRREAPQD